MDLIEDPHVLSYTKIILKPLTSNTSYFIVYEATYFGLYRAINRPDNDPVRAKTCSLIHNKI